MSTFAPARLVCAYCGSGFHAQVLTSLRARKSPDLTRRLLDGTLNRFVCPRCGRVTSAEPGFLYTDIEGGLCAAVLPERALRRHREIAASMEATFARALDRDVPDAMRSWTRRVDRRVVFGLDALAEKVALHHAALDDRLVEVLKLQVLKSGRLGPLSATAPLRVLRPEAGVLRVARRCAAGADGLAVELVAAVRISRYRALEAERSAWADRFPALFEGPVVDWRTLLLPEGAVDVLGPLQPLDR